MTTCQLQTLLSHIRSVTYNLVRKGSVRDQSPVPCLYTMEKKKNLQREGKAHQVEMFDGIAKCLIILWKNPFIRNAPANTGRKNPLLPFPSPVEISSLGTVVMVKNTGNRQSPLTQWNKPRLIIALEHWALDWPHCFPPSSFPGSAAAAPDHFSVKPWHGFVDSSSYGRRSMSRMDETPYGFDPSAPSLL